MLRSIINNKVQILFNDSDTSMEMMMDSESARSTCEIMSRSALQSPDVRRAELTAMLRRARAKQQSAKGQKTYWTGFMANYVASNANSNDSTAIN